MLLRLRLANHRSIRDEAEFSLVSAGLRSASPPGGDWVAATTRVAGIYGANAAGKSTVLDGFRALVTAVRNSATLWSDSPTFPHTPFAFDAGRKREPSTYELDFTVGGVRHSFGYRATGQGVVEEWLYAFPTSRRRTLYERGGDAGIEFGRHLPGDNVRIARALQPTQLYLSLAAANKHPVLHGVRKEIVGRVRFARSEESDRRARLNYVMRLLVDEESLREAEALLSLADFGIAGLRLRDVEFPAGMLDTLRRLLAPVGDVDPTRNGQVDADEFIEQYRKKFHFVHGTDPDDTDHGLPIEEESNGTVSWLLLAVPAMQSIKRGGAFVVDEIDSSLHPRLTATLIDFFKQPEVNAQGAQLIFTSHDTSLLGPLHGDVLEPDEVWVAEKDGAGATELYSIADFPVRPQDNLERRYLHGRYGGVPMVARDSLRSVFARRAS